MAVVLGLGVAVLFTFFVIVGCFAALSLGRVCARTGKESRLMSTIALNRVNNDINFDLFMLSTTSKPDKSYFGFLKTTNRKYTANRTATNKKLPIRYRIIQ